MARRRKKKYVPHLAEFYFKPTLNWSPAQARRRYFARTAPLGEVPLDTVVYEDCIPAMKRLPARSIDLVVADPPFGIAFNGKSSAYNRDPRNVVDGYEEVIDDYAQFTTSWISALERVMKDTASAYIFSGWTNLEDILRTCREHDLYTLNHIIWHYNFGMFTRKKFVTSHYHILLVVKDINSFFFNKVEHYPADVWYIKREYRPKEMKNGTKLPEALVKRCIDFSSKPGDVVLDPFMGNGTTAVACKGNFRHFIGFELNIGLRPIIENALDSKILGIDYTGYHLSEEMKRELRNKYPRAAKVYDRLRGKQHATESS